VSKAKAKEASSEKAVKADPKKAIVKPARAAPKTESDAHVKAAEKKTTTKPKAKKEASVEDIVSEATSAVDLSLDTDLDPVTAAIELPKGALVINDDEDDIPVQNLAITGATADPVKDYLKQIGKVALLNAELEVELAKRIEAGLFAEDKLATESKLAPADRRDLNWVVKDGKRSKSHLLEANLRLVVSLAKRYTGTRHAVPRFDSRGKPRLDSCGREI